MIRTHGLHQWARAEMLGLFSVSATLAGLCLTIATLFNIFDPAAALATMADNILTLCALMFVTCNLLIFYSMRVEGSRSARRLCRLIEVLFFGGQITMLLCCMVIVWSAIK